MAELPSGKAPTTRVRRRISRMMRSSELLVLMWRQCSSGNAATFGDLARDQLVSEVTCPNCSHGALSTTTFWIRNGRVADARAIAESNADRLARPRSAKQTPEFCDRVSLRSVGLSYSRSRSMKAIRDWNRFMKSR